MEGEEKVGGEGTWDRTEERREAETVLTKQRKTPRSCVQSYM